MKFQVDVLEVHAVEVAVQVMLKRVQAQMRMLLLEVMDMEVMLEVTDLDRE